MEGKCSGYIHSRDTGWNITVQDMRRCSFRQTLVWWQEDPVESITKNLARFGSRGCLNLFCLLRVDFSHYSSTKTALLTQQSLSYNCMLRAAWKQAWLALRSSHHCHLPGTAGLPAEVLSLDNSCAAADPQGHIKHWVLWKTISF